MAATLKSIDYNVAMTFILNNNNNNNNNNTVTVRFTKIGEMTGADKVMNPQHFGRYPADIRT